jgi:putative heme iron utilization protein
VRSEGAEAVRRLVREARHAPLATNGLEPAGHPFGSLVQLSSTEEGEPVFLISHLAQHTKNLQADARASVLLFDLDAEDPLQAPRATLVGTARRLPPEAEAHERPRFLARHPEAGLYFDLGFQLWALRPDEARFIGGFGAAAWIGGAELLGP